MKKLFIFSLLSLLIIMLASAFAPSTISSLIIVNKIAGEPVHLRMNGVNSKTFYSLTAHSPTHATGTRLPWTRVARFDVIKDLYRITITLCDTQRNGTLNMYKPVRLVFPDCSASVVNAGEPRQEKVDVFNAIPGTANWEEAGTPGDGVELVDHVYNGQANGSQIWWRLDWYNWWNGWGDTAEPFAP